MKLNISIELNGSERHVGFIIGTGAYVPSSATVFL